MYEKFYAIGDFHGFDVLVTRTYKSLNAAKKYVNKQGWHFLKVIERKRKPFFLHELIRKDDACIVYER